MGANAMLQSTNDWTMIFLATSVVLIVPDLVRTIVYWASSRSDQPAGYESIEKLKNLLLSEIMPFLHGGKRGHRCHDSNRNHRPEQRRHRQEQQEPGQFISHCVKKAESFADEQG